MHLEGKVVLVTGASEGIGLACASAFRQRGALLALTARREEKLREAARSGETVIAADLLRPDDRRRVVDSVLAERGRIDVLVNSAGAGLYAPSHRTPIEETRRLWELNFFALLEMAQLTAESMKARRSGVIVNIGSIAGKMTLPWFTLYSASKFAVGALTEGLRMELRPHHVHAMLVCPGYVRTGFQKNVIAGSPPDLGPGSRRWSITPEQCAEAIVRGIERNARTVVTPRSGWVLIALARLFPSQTERILGSLLRKQEARQ